MLIGHQCKVKLLFPFGPHLISIDEESQLFVFDIKAESQIIHIEFDKKVFDITTVCHPMTYKDKILLGSSQVNFFNILKKYIEATTAVFLFNRSSRRKRGIASNPLFIIPDFFLHFPKELSYGYLRFDGNGKSPFGCLSLAKIN